MKKFITHREVSARVADIARRIGQGQTIYGVPRGGVAPAYMLAGMTDGKVVDDPLQANIIIDDLIDSGRTYEAHRLAYPNAKFFALFEKELPIPPHTSNEWLVFPWEVKGDQDESSFDIFGRLLQFVGEDLDREGLKETPKRMAKMYGEITAGYSENPGDYFKSFSENAEAYDQLITEEAIPFYSMCEHHVVPFFGEVIIGYIPDKKLVGLSKLVRVVNTFSKRLQIQERMTHQIANTIQEYIDPIGVAVVVKARHLCMEMRGVARPGVRTTTSAMLGRMLTDSKARAEFFSLTNK
jgi:GTP cyclohydrolase IA